jgi:D-glycero-D-manno-heptose 1,7-bisphosphate phosphatase
VSQPAFFLDRDGTINVDRVYINDARLIELIPGAAEAITKARRAGYKIVVITNQSGVGRGIIELSALDSINGRVDELLEKEAGAKVDRYEMCIHHPSEDCPCRKPKPFLVHQAARALDIDLARSVFVGDKFSDVATGHNSGCRHSILVRTGKGVDEEMQLKIGAPVKHEELPDFIADDLAGAVDWALAQAKG